MQKDNTMGFSLHHTPEAGGEAPPSPCWEGENISKQKSVKKEMDFGGANTLWPLQSHKGNMIYTRNGASTELCQSPTRKQQAHSGWVTWIKGLSTKAWAGYRETIGIGQNLEAVSHSDKEREQSPEPGERKGKIWKEHGLTEAVALVQGDSQLMGTLGKGTKGMSPRFLSFPLSFPVCVPLTEAGQKPES